MVKQKKVKLIVVQWNLSSIAIAQTLRIAKYVLTALLMYVQQILQAKTKNHKIVSHRQLYLEQFIQQHKLRVVFKVARVTKLAV